MNYFRLASTRYIKINRFFIIIICVHCFSMAASRVLAGDVGIMQWVESYSATRDLSRFDEFWKSTVGKGALEADPAVRGFVIGFTSQVVHFHPSLLKGRIEGLDQFPEKQRDSIRILLWWADTDYSREILKKSGDSALLKDGGPSGVESIPVERIWDLNFCIGSFYATGDLNTLKPLLKYIAKDRLDPNDELLDAVISELKDVCRKNKGASALVDEQLNKKRISRDSRVALLLILNRTEEIEREASDDQPKEPAKEEPAKRVKPEWR